MEEDRSNLNFEEFVAASQAQLAEELMRPAPDSHKNGSWLGDESGENLNETYRDDPEGYFGADFLGTPESSSRRGEIRSFHQNGGTKLTQLTEGINSAIITGDPEGFGRG